MLQTSVQLHQIFQDAVDDCLRGILGNAAAEVFYSHLTETCNLPQRDLPTRLGEFEVAIGFVFGQVAQTIKTAMAEHFYWKLGLTFTEQPNATLQDYVDNAILEKAIKLATLDRLGQLAAQ